MRIDNNFLLNALLGITLVFCTVLTGCGSGSVNQGVSLSIDAPTSASSYSTTGTTIRLGGTISGASVVHVRNDLTGYTTDGYIFYSSQGQGTWFGDVYGLAPGDNPITVTADGVYSFAQKHITVIRPLQPANLIINGPNQSSSSTYWTALDIYKIALFGDGTGRSTTGKFNSGTVGNVVDCTWSSIGPDAIIITNCPDCTFQKITRISGSFSERIFYGTVETVGNISEIVIDAFILTDGNL